MANQFTKIGILQRDTYADLLDKSMDLIWLRKDRFAGNLDQFFEKVTAESLTYKISSVSSVVGLPLENEDTDKLPYVQPAPGYDTTFTLVSYRSAIRATDTMRRADRFGMLAGMMTGLTKSALRKIEYLRAAIFNNAFTSGTGGDGQYLCVDSHPQENPEVTAWDNLGTGALTHGNLQALRLLGDKMTSEIGCPDPVVLKTLLVGPTLRQKANELIGASLMPENALNQPNVLIRDLNLVVSPFITSTTAYFGFGDLEGEEKGLLESYLMEPEMANVNPENPDIIWAKRVKFIVKIGFTQSRNCFGSTGA